MRCTPSVDGGRQKITIEEALQERQFAKIYLMIGINEMGTGTVETFAGVPDEQGVVKPGLIHRGVFPGRGRFLLRGISARHIQHFAIAARYALHRNGGE